MKDEKTQQIEDHELSSKESDEKLKEKQILNDNDEESTKNKQGVNQTENSESLEDEEQSTGEVISELRDELERAQDSLLRKAAELENLRKRVQRERTQLFESAKVNAVEKFLPINDDLQRTTEAIENAETDTAVDDHFVDGVTMIADKFQDTLKSLGVEPINETGVPFNVDLHDALFKQQPEDDSVESDTVLQIVENGYRMGDRTIRHAKVIVSE